MIAMGSIGNALYGAWRLANFDRSGFDRFEITADGFWHSFLAALIGVPLFALHALMERAAAETMLKAAGETPDFTNFYPLVAADYILLWPAFALLMIPFVRIAGVPQNYAALIISWNWARVVAMAIRLPVMAMVAYGALGTTALAVALLLTYGLILAYQWYVAKVALGTSGLAAGAVVLADVVLGVALATALSWVLGAPVTLVGQ